ncbi:hypothetical protein ACOQFV_24765 [Nocardiopsis changdeensis]|uniref:Albusnodin family lasso peptide n=1 Tax=Nocardiopsis changdeensis TaxID=2831969 RepID=A0A975KQL6_9ACTN|nr:MULTISPECIES: hypothetical protein [Nocardiopsis]QUX26549.1 hypothetical protein KGD84_33155 [Nocardiopsis changdeensis]QYX40668.1 hypothetical protein K1J57_32225 [Nocardiopsis sp. MT53]
MSTDETPRRFAAVQRGSLEKTSVTVTSGPLVDVSDDDRPLPLLAPPDTEKENGQ